MARTLTLAGLLLALTVTPLTRADEKDEVRRGLEQQEEFAERGRRIAQLERELAGASLWVQKAILTVELADTGDRRAVPPLGRALTDDHPHVVAFGLHALARLPAEDVRKGGGVPLFEGLLEALKVRSAYHRDTARRLLGIIVGEDLGPRAGRWKSWLRRHEEELRVEAPEAPFDESRYDAGLVGEVRAEDASGGTTVRPRIPSITSEIRELESNGLDIVLCLDQTGSMGGVIDETKAKIDVLAGVVAEVVEDYRIGLVTYDDAAQRSFPLSRNVGGLRELLQSVEAFGGGDMPEGVDKGLDVAFSPKFGWRRSSVKTVVILGDAPPHKEDIDANLAKIRQVHAQAQVIVNAVSTGHMKLPEFDAIAEAGGGQSLELGGPDKLVTEVLLLIFGERMRPAMGRFVPVLIEILEAYEKG